MIGRLSLKSSGRARKLSEMLSSLFWGPQIEGQTHLYDWLWIIILYALGIYFWGTFFNWGDVSLNFHDWAAINIPRFDVMHDAFYYRMLPLHAECENCLHGVTDRFLVLPDVVTTPQMILLLFVSPTVFVLVDVLINYSLAVIGLILIKKRFRLSLFSYTFLFVLFHFNGHIQSHYAVGHATWAGYFLFPLFFELVFQLLDEGPNWQWVTKITILLFYSVLAGSQHHFTWMMLFMAFLALSYRMNFKWILAAIMFSGFVSAVRLLPPALSLAKFSVNFFAVPGYQSVYDFITSLMVFHRPGYQFEAWPLEIGYWEFDYYIGLVGVVLVVYFGGVLWIKEGIGKESYSVLILPALALFLLSQGSIYKITLYNFPLLSSERIASRMASLPVTLVFFMAAISLNEVLKRKVIIIRWLSLLAMVFIVNDILVHSFWWKIESVAQNFRPELLNLSGNSIINHVDSQYLTVFYTGLILSLGTMLMLFMLVAIEKRKLQQNK